MIVVNVLVQEGKLWPKARLRADFCFHRYNVNIERGKSTQVWVVCNPLDRQGTLSAVGVHVPYQHSGQTQCNYTAIHYSDEWVAVTCLARSLLVRQPRSGTP